MDNLKSSIDVTIVGGGMITHDVILPSVFHLQRTGVVKDINVCALDSPPLKLLKESKEMTEAFPGQEFNAYPSLSEPEENKYPDLYKEVIAKMKPRQMVVVAMPDQLHYSVIMEALKNNQHVLCVKPLVLKYNQTVEIEKLAFEKGLFIGVEYHKRFDNRSLLAKKSY
ncbi:Gfo/Idh/MocA family oxidoreductase, partial [Mariniphaga sediminis]